MEFLISILERPDGAFDVWKGVFGVTNERLRFELETRRFSSYELPIW